MAFIPPATPIDAIGPNTTFMADPVTGLVTPVAPEYLGDAQGVGWRQASPEQVQQFQNQQQYGGMSGAAAAFLAGAGRGLTFGATDWAMTKTGLVNKETLKALEDIQPEASIGGEIAGIALPAILTGGEAAVARGAQRAAMSGAESLAAFDAAQAVGKAAGFTAPGVISKVAGKVAGSAGIPEFAQHIVKGAVEGGIWGNQRLVTQLALGDEDVVAEQLGASILHNTLMGAGAGAGAGFLGRALQSGARSVARGAAEQIDDIERSVLNRIDPTLSAKESEALYKGMPSDATRKQLEQLLKEEFDAVANSIAPGTLGTAALGYGAGSATNQLVSSGISALGLGGAAVGIYGASKLAWTAAKAKLADKMLGSMLADLADAGPVAEYGAGVFSAKLNLGDNLVRITNIATNLVTDVAIPIAGSQASEPTKFVNKNNAASVMARVNQLANNNGAVIDSVPNQLQGFSNYLYGQTVLSLSNTAQSASKSGSVPQQDPLMSYNPQVSATQIQQLNNELNLAANPLETLQYKLDKGTLTRSDMETLQRLYPSTMTAVRQAIAEQLADAASKTQVLPYNKRMLLNTVLGTSVTPQVSSHTLVQNQMEFSGGQEEPKVAPAQLHTKAIGKMNYSGRYETPSQAAQGILGKH